MWLCAAALPWAVPDAGTGLSGTNISSRGIPDAPGPCTATDTLDTATVSAEYDIRTTRSAPAQRMGRAAIERSGAGGLHEVLRTFPGISIRDYGGIGGVKTVSVRDIGSQHTAVCYDGVMVSDAQNGQVDISGFALDNISELTMETGASDDIFRSARLAGAAGVLSIRTDLRENSAGARMRFASFNTYNPGFFVNRRIGRKWTAGISADWLKSDGVYPFKLVNGSSTSEELRLNSDVNTLNTELNVIARPGQDDELRIKARFVRSERGLPGSVIYYSQDPTERLWNRNLSLSAVYRKDYGERFRLSQTLSCSDARDRYTNDSAIYQEMQDDRYVQQELASSTVLEYRFGRRLSVSFAGDIFTNTLRATIPECQDPSRLSAVSALSARWQDGHLTVTGVLSGTCIKEKVRTGEAAPPYGRLSPTISASWQFPGGIRLRASYRDGFRVPTFNDLYYSRTGNKGLRPEKARQANAGLTWTSHGNTEGRLSGLSLSADLYCNVIEDKILAVPMMFIWKMRNLGRVRMTGTEISASGDIRTSARTRLRFNANYSFRHAVDITDPGAKNYGHQIQYTPRHSGNIRLSLTGGLLDCSYVMNAVGRRYSLPQNIAANEMPAYFDHAVSASREFAFGDIRLRISAEALNLGNVNYEVVRYYPMPGRNYRLTMKITYR